MMSDLSTDYPNLPKHLAFIMDGNGRWAKERGLSRTMGHRRGVRAVKNIVKAALKYKIPYLTLYAFSTENFNRPPAEVSFLMKLCTRSMGKYKKFFIKNGIKFLMIGSVDRLPKELQLAIGDLRDATETFSELTLIVAINYGARAEIIDAIRGIVRKKIPESGITWETVADHLHTRGLPDPDMIIRTSGEKRLSNFLLLQAAYAELHFLDTYWPDVDEKTFIEVLREYARRNRRMGIVQR
ncbi:MAG: di-trans,poly-cis-decaprenylcistransferase [Puniceicoccales bacterium]|jgi:undecaprenyl diphosphate synthase|nr:di-trans,poly-cis-decaprenylcistransferase [Puniceicoccales bacterium]